MKSDDEVTDTIRKLSLAAARENDVRQGTPYEYHQALGGVTALCWAMGMTQEETNDALAWGIVMTYRESPSILRAYFKGDVPERFKVYL